MKDVKKLNEKHGHKPNAFKKVCMHLLKGLCVVVGAVIAGFSFITFFSVVMAIGVVFGLGYGICEATYNLKELKDRFFRKQPNILDDYYEMQKIKDLKSAMDLSKHVQDYVSTNNVDINCDAIAQPEMFHASKLLAKVKEEQMGRKMVDKALT